jgi:hypothetical protein
MSCRYLLDSCFFDSKAFTPYFQLFSTHKLCIPSSVPSRTFPAGTERRTESHSHRYAGTCAPPKPARATHTGVSCATLRPATFGATLEYLVCGCQQSPFRCFFRCNMRDTPWIQLRFVQSPDENVMSEVDLQGTMPDVSRAPFDLIVRRSWLTSCDLYQGER